MTQTHFGDRLNAAIARFGPLCLGLDPYPERIPDAFGPTGLEAVEAFLAAAVEGAAGRVGVVKPQIALFERFGPEGLASLARLTQRAREAGLIVLLDAKRGDIGATAAGYADAYLGPDAWLHADAITVNAYMGTDAIAPFLDRADAAGKGVIVLVRTSNPGGGQVQGLQADGAPVYVRLAETLAPYVEERRGEAGWSSMMFVVGATAPDEARLVRRVAPAAHFLAPGYGAQGGSAADAMAGAVWRGERGEGVVVNASRSLLYPHATPEAATVEAWSGAFAAAIEAAKGDLSAVRDPAAR